MNGVATGYIIIIVAINLILKHNYYIEVELDLSQSFFDEDSGDDADDPQAESYSKPLYQGAPDDLTEYIAHQLLFQFSVKHSLTAKALEELLHLMAVFLPSDAALPKSVRQLKAFFLKTHSDASPVIQKYCPTCHVTMKETEKSCCRCQTTYSEFVTVPIGPQLKARLESKCINVQNNDFLNDVCICACMRACMRVCTRVCVCVCVCVCDIVH
ncbi:hypothetical protein SPBRAN_884 [uncultured Candidatus Thioglobus sp.]|nr:hypothetical protein SPBRAN_884 [uncultured Candidatus Thioglobus sp.]